MSKALVLHCRAAHYAINGRREQCSKNTEQCEHRCTDSDASIFFHERCGIPPNPIFEQIAILAGNSNWDPTQTNSGSLHVRNLKTDTLGLSA